MEFSWKWLDLLHARSRPCGRTKPARRRQMTACFSCRGVRSGNEGVRAPESRAEWRRPVARPAARRRPCSRWGAATEWPGRAERQAPRRDFGSSRLHNRGWHFVDARPGRRGPRRLLRGRLTPQPQQRRKDYPRDGCGRGQPPRRAAAPKRAVPRCIAIVVGETASRPSPLLLVIISATSPVAIELPALRTARHASHERMSLFLLACLLSTHRDSGRFGQHGGKEITAGPAGNSGMGAPDGRQDCGVSHPTGAGSPFTSHHKSDCRPTLLQLTG